MTAERKTYPTPTAWLIFKNSLWSGLVQRLMKFWPSLEMGALAWLGADWDRRRVLEREKEGPQPRSTY